MIFSRVLTGLLLATGLAWPSFGQDSAALIREAQGIEAQILAKRSEVFEAQAEEVVVFMAGIIDLAIAPDADKPPTARAVGRIELVVDVATSTVTGEIYGVVGESGEVGGLEGATLRLDGYMTEPSPGSFGVWVESPMTSVGRPTQATRASLRGDFTLVGQSAPRGVFGAVAGTVRIGSGTPQTLSGAAALLEVERAPATKQ